MSRLPGTWYTVTIALFTPTTPINWIQFHMLVGAFQLIPKHPITVSRNGTSTVLCANCLPVNCLKWRFLLSPILNTIPVTNNINCFAPLASSTTSFYLLLCCWMLSRNFYGSPFIIIRTDNASSSLLWVRTFVLLSELNSEHFYYGWIYIHIQFPNQPTTHIVHRSCCCSPFSSSIFMA